MENIYNELLDLFYDYQPNDESFLEAYPELAEEMEAIENRKVKDSQQYADAILELCDFLNEWFPDSVDEEEQERVREAIDAGYRAVKEHKEVCAV